VTAALLRLPVLRLARSPRAWIPPTAWSVLALGFALAARSDGAPNGADHVLVGAFGALFVPLLAYALVGGVLGGRSLAGSTAPVVAFGASPARAAAVTIVGAIGACAMLAAGLGAAVAAVAHGVDDPPIAHDAVATAYASALGGAAYAALFAMGASFGRRGGGRTVLLVADWLLGSGDSVVAAMTPRGHLRNLLGGAAPAQLGERTSAAVLVALALVFVLVATARARRA
jgi:hypothetical protein